MAAIQFDSSWRGRVKVGSRSFPLSRRSPVTSEGRLVEDALAGDRSAFDDLVRTLEEDLRLFVRRRVADYEVDDVVQETWLAAWSALAAFDRRSRFKTWVFGIALNKCRDHYRQRKEPSERLADRAEIAGDERAFRNTELTLAIREVLEALPATQKEVLELYYFSGLNLAEVAKSLGRNLNTVKYQFYRAHAEAASRLGSMEDARYVT
ncbi:MAG TPA: sigma-70 family RNA polymerase sigma factor [Fimbriimonadaceae bacterium]|nr:sigma-70 family RNA polymerase sigma factor [Fimbriimonadaceae bacterium]HRJ96532.1 sigma-70 family RNA polymerase sigma factor [Fimbriimonadaceae bacterium]